MNAYRRERNSRDCKIGKYSIALIFIVFGIMSVGRNIGLIPHGIFRIVISWQMLLIVIGLFSLLVNRSTGGFIPLIIGTFFMIPLVTGEAARDWMRAYWPLIFVFVGIFLIVKRTNPRNKCGKDFKHASYDSIDGFLKIDNTFGSSKQIVLDPIFKGANIENVFGGVQINLRKTALSEGDTIIRVDCTFGGVEIFAPDDWLIIFEIDSTFGGCNDKRLFVNNPDASKRLIIKGDVTFGGLEIKS